MKLLRPAALALTLVLPASWCGAESGLDRALDTRLDRLVLQAQERPAAALQALRKEQAPAHASQLRFAEGQMQVHAGELVVAGKIADELAAQPGGKQRAELLRALIADHDGALAPAADAARRSLTGLEGECPRGREAEAIAAGCDFRTAMAALRVIWREQSSLGALASAVDSAERAQALARAANDSFHDASISADLALFKQELGQGDEARRWLASALTLAQDDPLAMAGVKIAEARVAVRRGDKSSQLRAYEEALGFAQRAGAEHTLAKIQVSLTDLHMHNGRPALALEYAGKALPATLRFKDLRLERTLRHNAAVCHIMLRQFDAARRALQRSTELAETQPDPVRRALELREIGEAWAAAGQPREAIAAFHLERELSAQTDARNRETQLQALQLKYDSGRKQRDLELLKADRALKDRQLANRDLARWVGIAVGLLALLSVVLVGLMLKRVRMANKRLKANEQLLRAQSERDALTDLANRRHFLAVMQSQPEGRLNGALLMVDIDHFKHVNDRHGHASGDIVICEVARRIAHAVRHEDLVVRWGGEEFLVFAPGVEQTSLQLLAERILFSVGNSPVTIATGPLRVTVSIGFAHFPLPPDHLQVPWEQAVNWADKALYTAKAQGRNCAIGIVDVAARDEAALQQLEADFDAACSSERVRLRKIVGPQEPALGAGTD